MCLWPSGFSGYLQLLGGLGGFLLGMWVLLVPLLCLLGSGVCGGLWAACLLVPGFIVSSWFSEGFMGACGGGGFFFFLWV